MPFATETLYHWVKRNMLPSCKECAVHDSIRSEPRRRVGADNVDRRTKTKSASTRLPPIQGYQ